MSPRRLLPIEIGCDSPASAADLENDQGSILVGGAVVGAVGVSGLDHHNDLQIADSAAAVVK